MNFSKNTLTRFGSLQALAKIAVIAINENAVIQYHNTYAAELLGFNADDSIIDTAYQSLLHQLRIPQLGNKQAKDEVILQLNNRWQRWQEIEVVVDKADWRVMLGHALPTANDYVKQLATQQIHLNNIIQNLPELVYWKDEHCVYQGCNHRVAELLHLATPADIVGKTDYDFGWTDERIQSLQVVDLAILREGKNSIVEDIIPVNGINNIFLTSKTPLYDNNGKVIGILGISTDITERKKLEESLRGAQRAAEAANHAKTEFLENMRHDIRTPLTGIVGFSELLKVESGEPRIKEYADNLVASSHALLHLMDEVLEAIRVSSGEIPKLKCKFNLQKTIEHVIDLNRAKSAHKQLAISFNVDKAIPQFLVGDKIRIHRVALELLTNAINFTDHGFVKLMVSLYKQEGRELIIKLCVQDSGIGIPKDKQQDIYLQFKRLTPSYQGIYKGAGLGLSVIKQFIDDLGGEIYVVSEPGKGSTFTCLIPLQQSLSEDDEGIDTDFERQVDAQFETTATFPKILNASSDMQAQPTMHRILVVEDSPIAQKVAQSLLAKCQCETDIADCGQKALELANAREYDLIFMDIGLPDMEGYEVTHRIRVNELSKKTHTPIIALTAHAGDENKKRCIESGMNAVLSKPLTLQNCYDIIESFIPGQRQDKSEQDLSKEPDLPINNAHLFELSQCPLLNLDEGMNTLGDKAILFDMLKLMINGALANDIALLHHAHETNDWDKIQQLAHKIKGGAIYIGATRMKMACLYLERYFKSGQRDLLEPLYQQVITVLDSSVKAMTDALKSA